MDATTAPHGGKNPCNQAGAQTHDPAATGSDGASDLRSDFAADDAFFHWLAGFIDGEGSFTIRWHIRGWWTIRLVLKVRADDAEIIDEIHRRTGFGAIYSIAASGDAKPQVAWQVERKTDVAALVRLLDRYPLRAKKRHDYTIWRQAVAEWHGLKRPAVLADMKARLEGGRAFEPTDAEGSPEPADDQLDLLAEGTLNVSILTGQAADHSRKRERP